MCGIVGFQLFKNKNKEPKFIINRLVNELKHRGPDLRGEWESIDDKLYLGHTRLSIIDLSEEGKQPMHSLNGRYVIVFNGEIYNYKKLMKQLNQDFSYNLQKVSDTRVLLECISSYGLNKTIQIINGMYSFVIWDKKEKKNILSQRHIWGKTFIFLSWI